MLDINKLLVQIEALGNYQAKHSIDMIKSLSLAKEQLKHASEHCESLSRKIENAKTSWLVAIPTSEGFSNRYPAPSIPDSYIAVSTDGSQIEPSRHISYSAFLINIGEVILGYGKNHGYRLESEPYLFFEDSETMRLYGGEERPVSGPVLAAVRQKMESEALINLIQTTISSSLDNPILAFIDGTLILWALEQKPEKLFSLPSNDLKVESLKSFLLMLSIAKQNGVPVVGYISSPSGSDVVNSLKIDICPNEPVNCDKCPFKQPMFGDEQTSIELPCAKINKITDAHLFSTLLKNGERSPLFESRSEIIKAYENEKILFFYLNTGKEIARVEVPAWVAKNKETIDKVHAICLDQANKGNGYPIVIAEAHEQAVVKATERSFFQQLVEKTLIQKGTTLKESRKALRKRGGFI